VSGTELHHYGSRYYMNDMSQAEKDGLYGAIIVDMVGVGSQLYARTMGVGPMDLCNRLMAFAQGKGIFPTLHGQRLLLRPRTLRGRRHPGGVAGIQRRPLGTTPPGTATARSIRPTSSTPAASWRTSSAPCRGRIFDLRSLKTSSRFFDLRSL